MSRCNFCCDDYIDEYRQCCPPRPYPPRPYPPMPCPPKPYPPKPDSCCCRGPRGASAFEVAQYHGFTGTEAAWLESLRGTPGATGATGAAGATGPWLSSYMEAYADSQVIGRGASVAFDPASIESVGGNITLNQAGTIFTINRTGLYLVEWNLNLAAGNPQAVMGIVENGAGASGATSSAAGSFSSGTLINVTTVPFTLSLHNYVDPCTIERHLQYEDGAASIRIVRFADGPSV